MKPKLNDKFQKDGKTWIVITVKRDGTVRAREYISAQEWGTVVITCPYTDVEPRSGSVRWTNDDGKIQVAAPGDPMYSTALMFPVEYWDGNQWRKA